MRGVIVWFWLFTLAQADSFITKKEYAAGLYHNPRGVGCHLCHGENGGGKLIARYRDDGKKQVFEGKAINKLSFKEFYEKVNGRIIGMPHYYLTDTEIQTLYYYLHREEFQRAANQPRKTQ